MRAHLPTYDMVAPKTLAEALQLLDAEPGIWQPFAGGTDLMVMFEAGKLAHQKFISIWQLQELRGISEESSAVNIGALTSFSEIRQSKLIGDSFPLLTQAAATVGAVAIQNRGTVGGNIMNASPAGDSLPVLLAYDARIELTSQSGSRWVEYASFHTGYKKTVAKSNELLTRVCLSKTEPWTHQYFRKVAARAAQAISKLCMAGLMRMDQKKVADCRIALGSVAPIPLRCRKTESVIMGEALTPAVIKKAQQVLSTELAPIDDIRSTSAYRSLVARNLLGELLSSV